MIRGGTIVDSGGARRGDVLVDGERIAAVGPGIDPPADAHVFDAAGAYVIPGAIDVHTHFALPVGALRSADDFTSGTMSAACGGTTCVIDFAGAGREPWTEALAAWHARADGASVVDFGLHLTVTEVPSDHAAAAQRFAHFAELGVTSVKLYMAYPDRLMVDDATLLRALVASKATGVRVMVHAEDGLEVERLSAEAVAAGRIAPDAFPGTRPAAAEASAIHRAAKLAAQAGAELYVVHLSSAAGLEAVREARLAGSSVRVETCPHYLYLDAASLADPELGQDFMCSPPLRSSGDREALWGALASGEIDVVSTDHCPFTSVNRRHGTSGGPCWTSFREIPGGLPGVETRVPLLHQGVVDGRITPERWVELVAGAPARLFGLSARKGALQVGLDADVVVFDPSLRRSLDARSLHSASDVSPYAGMHVTGWPVLTLSRGRTVARDGQPADAEPGWGRFAARARAW